MDRRGRFAAVAITVVEFQRLPYAKLRRKKAGGFHKHTGFSAGQLQRSFQGRPREQAGHECQGGAEARRRRADLSPHFSPELISSRFWA